MRALLTTLAILVILALTAALVGPLFVDWSTHADWLEAQLSRLVGEPVHLGGPVGLRLLPTPVLDLREVSVGTRDKDGAPFAADAIHLELAMSALLRGELLFTEVRIERPRLRLARSGLSRPPNADGPRSIAFDHLTVHGGTLIAADRAGGPPLSLDGIDLTGEVSSLIGPAHGSGRFRTAGGPVDFHFSSGAIAKQRMPLKFSATRDGGVLRADLDGTLIFGEANDASTSGPRFEGHGTLSGTGNGNPLAGQPWSAAGDLTADLNAVAWQNLDLHVGDDRRFLRIAGSAAFAYRGTPAAKLSLVAKRVDIDRQFASNEGGRVRPLDALAALRRALDDAGGPGGLQVPVALDFAIGVATLGGEVLTGITGSFAFAPGQELHGKIAGNAPGDSHLSLDGSFDLGVAPGFRGKIDLATRGRVRLVAWAAQGEPSAVDWITRLVPFRTLAVSGDAEISAVSFAVRDLSATLDRSSFTGSIAFESPIGGERGRLFAYLDSNALDIDSLPDFRGLVAKRSNLDLSLDIAAKTARVADVAAMRVETGKLAVKFNRTADLTTLEWLAIDGLGGGRLRADGTVDSNGGRFKGHLDATDFSGIAGLMRHFLPIEVADALAARAGALSPASVDMIVRTAPNGAVEALALEGSAGGSKIKGALDRLPVDPGGIVANLKIEAAEAGKLLRQIGLAGPAPRAVGSNSIELAARGRWGDSLVASFKATVAGTEAAWHGRFSRAEGGLDGPLSLSSADVSPWLRGLRFVADPSPAVPASVLARLSLRAGGIELRDISATVGTVKLAGRAALTWSTDPTQGSSAVATPASAKITGTFSIDRLALPNLVALVLAAPRAGAGPWASARFAKAPASLPPISVALRIGRFDLGASAVRDAPLAVHLEPGQLMVRLEPAAFQGGTLGGDAALRRDGAAATLTGRVAMSGVAIERPFAGGKVSGGVEFVGSGDSPRALIASLAGQGSLSLGNAVLPGLDAGAVGRVVAAVDAETLPLDAEPIQRRLERETQRGAAESAELDVPVLIAGGRARLGPAALPAPNARVEASGQIDLATLGVDLDETVALTGAPTDWEGPPPSFTVVWSGTWASPNRHVEAANVFNGLSARALTINLQRLEDFDADARERAFFNRRLKVIREDEARERQRQADNASWQDLIMAPAARIGPAAGRTPTGVPPPLPRS